MSIKEEVILVDEHDQPLGTMEKLEAHKKGLLHRAFSILIFNTDGHLLLHKRADTKYHSPGLWTNACCSHPRPAESLQQATYRRLMEEMGFTTELHYLFNFIYKVAFDNGLYEHELDHVFTGKYDEVPPFNTQEVSEAQFFSPEYVNEDIQMSPHKYTEWFKIIWSAYNQLKY